MKLQGYNQFLQHIINYSTLIFTFKCPVSTTDVLITTYPDARDCHILARTGNCEKIPVRVTGIYFDFTDGLFVTV